MTTEEKVFQDVLDKVPNDQITRSVFADWLEDHGDPRAAGYRKLVAMDKYPRLFTVDTTPHWHRLSGTKRPEPTFALFFGYTTEDNPHNNDAGNWRSALPREWYEKYKAREPVYSDPKLASGFNRDWWQVHETRRVCEDAAALAFAEIAVPI